MKRKKRNLSFLILVSILIFSTISSTIAENNIEETMDSAEINTSEKNTSSTDEKNNDIDLNESINEEMIDNVGSLESNKLEELDQTQTYDSNNTNETDSFKIDSAEIPHQISNIDGDGSEQNPYLVSNFKELREAIEIPHSKTEPKQIKFAADIEDPGRIIYEDYPLSYTIGINHNIVIDGGYHTLYREHKDVGTYPLLVKQSDITVYIKNLFYGGEDEEKRASSYYGIVNVEALAKRVNLIFENITYISNYGAQPFHSHSEDTILTLKGTNKFDMSGIIGGGEFAERFAEVIIEGNTYVKNFSSGNEYQIFHTVKELRISENASFEVYTDKYKFSILNMNISLEANAKFKYISDYNPQPILHINKVSMKQNSSFEMLVNGGDFLTANVLFEVDNPKYIKLEHSDLNKRPLYDSKWTIRQKPISNLNYVVSILQNGKQDENLNFGSNGEFIITNNLFNKFHSVLYTKLPEDIELIGESLVGDRVSDINLQIKSKNQSAVHDKFQYKVTTKSLLIDDNINSNESQLNIGKEELDGVLISEENIFTEMSYFRILNTLEPGTYYIYARSKANLNFNDYSFGNPWIEIQVVVDRFENITITNASRNFTSPTVGDFSDLEGIGNPINFINKGNTAIKVTITEITSSYDNGIYLGPKEDLSSSLIKAKSKKHITSYDDLLLNSEYDGWLTLWLEEINNDKPIKLGSLSLDNNTDQSYFILPPFWGDKDNCNTENFVQMILKGKYEGSIEKVRNVSYNVSFKYEYIK